MTTDTTPVAGDLDAALRAPRTWTLVVVRDLGQDSALHVLCGDDARDLPGNVRSIHLTWPGSTVLALVPHHADAGIVVDALDAGADGCLRGSQPDEVRAHLSALHRRRALACA